MSTEKRFRLTQKGVKLWEGFAAPFARFLLLSPAQNEIVYCLGFHWGCEEYWTAEELKDWINTRHAKTFTTHDILRGLTNLEQRRYVQ